MQTWKDVKVAVRAKGAPAEGPIWDERAGVLWWVDIIGQAVHEYNPATGKDRVIPTPSAVGTVVPRERDGLVVALQNEIAALDPSSGEVETIAKVIDDPKIRFNDGKCDPQGRLWAGTMAFDAAIGAGAFYRIDAGGNVTEIFRDVSISNGLGWSLDHKTMYYIDSLAFGVDALDFDPTTGKATARRRLIDVPESEGLCDGMTMDAEGHLWVAIYNGSAVRRYTPDGEHVGTVEVPVKQVTACAFGGPDMTDLFITSAADDDPDSLSGSLFHCHVGIEGLPTNLYAG